MRFLAIVCLVALGMPLVGAEDPPATPAVAIPLTHERPMFSWGGWVSLLYRDGNSDAVDAYTGVPNLYLHGDYRFRSKWRLFAEVEYEEEPGLFGQHESELILERMFLEYRKSAALIIRLGKFNTRAGIVKPLHWSITLDAVGPPIMESNSYVPAKSSGLELLGSRIQPNGEWRYAFSLSTSDQHIDTGEGIEEAKGSGVDLSYLGAGGYRVGGSFFYYLNPGEDDERSVRAWQPYLEVEPVPGKVQIRAEYLALFRGSDEDIRAWYGKVRWDTSIKTYLNYRYDRGDDDRDAEGEERETQTLTFAWRPKNNWRMKLELGENHFPDNPNADFTEWSAWMGYVFP